MQAAVMKELGERLRKGLEAMDPETLMKTWMPLGLEGLEQAQKMFWPPIGKVAGGARGVGET